MMERERPTLVAERTVSDLLAVLLRELSETQKTDIRPSSFLVGADVQWHEDGYVDVVLRRTGRTYRIWVEELGVFLPARNDAEAH